jgi:hypothetical protein
MSLALCYCALFALFCFVKSDARKKNSSRRLMGLILYPGARFWDISFYTVNFCPKTCLMEEVLAECHVIRPCRGYYFGGCTMNIRCPPRMRDFLLDDDERVPGGSHHGRPFGYNPCRAGTGVGLRPDRRIPALLEVSGSARRKPRYVLRTLVRPWHRPRTVPLIRSKTILSVNAGHSKSSSVSN